MVFIVIIFNICVKLQQSETLAKYGQSRNRESTYRFSALIIFRQKGESAVPFQFPVRQKEYSLNNRHFTFDLRKIKLPGKQTPIPAAGKRVFAKGR
ncbi:hypothetical protein HQ47_05325 [Porphyromonas macacae]|uniref:Uncharacterized protein n=1 Tax=Porphyromonas macacae TaxID=28115 RepID=A0A0A2E6H9_9PORP|nr:hypothetical protein HQ47_05325 [Porphyromonas macacae]